LLYGGAPFGRGNPEASSKLSTLSLVSSVLESKDAIRFKTVPTSSSFLPKTYSILNKV
jgi:hypothetical protein